jgi:MFS superfamily sulfate permease-like transporter
MVVTGILQILFGICQFAHLLQFVSDPTMRGFVNSLAIIIFYSQFTGTILSKFFSSDA